jgi:uncharacterized small protein (DUF1192 family)
MPLKPEDRAAYQRVYRSKAAQASRAKAEKVVEGVLYEQRIAELEDEVRHLKAELAKRVTSASQYAAPSIAGGFNTRPFTPVPRQRDKPKGK